MTTRLPPVYRAVLCALVALPASAQDAPPPLFSYPDGRPRAITVTALPSLQDVRGEGPLGTDTVRVAQWALPVIVSVPITQDVGLGFRVGYSSSFGGDVETLRQASDAQATLAVSRPLGAGRVVAVLGADLPVGETLAPGEAATAFLVGQGPFAFRALATKRGFGLAPSVAWASPLADGVAVGAGISYRYRGAFEPWTGAGARYDPGDELALTAGIDYRLGDASVVALDVLAARYGTDVWGALEYDAGGAVGASARWTASAGRRETHIFGRVHRRIGHEVPPEVEGRLGPGIASPTEGRLHAQTLFHVDRRVSVGLTTGIRAYAASEVLTRKVLLDVGIENGISVTDGLNLVGRYTETFGSLRGTSAALGLSWSL